MTLTYYVATSVDGYIADSEGGIDGFLTEGKHIQDFYAEINHYDRVLMGRKTYEFGYRYGLQPGEVAYQGLKHLVFSSQLQLSKTNPDLEISAENPVEKVKALKAQSDKTESEEKLWLCGGGQLAGTLLTAGLIDEVVLKVNPFIQGQGIPLFANVDTVWSLKHVKTLNYNHGVHVMYYRVEAP